MSNQSNKKDNNWIWLPAMIFCFATGLWPIALVILFWKIVNGGKTTVKSDSVRKKVDQVSKAADDLRKSASDFVGTVTGPAGKTAGTANKTADGTPNAAKNKKIPGGMALIAVGASLAGVFGFAAMGFVAEMAESLLRGHLFAHELVPVLVMLAGLVTGLALLLAGVGKNRRRERWLNYLGYIGTNRQVDLAPMAASFGVSVRRLCDDLRKMLAEKVLPTGWLDLRAGKLILSETGYQAPPKAQPTPQPEPEPAPPQDDNAILAEIRAVNDAIPDPVMSEKIDRIGEITGKILDYQRRNPGKDSQLRSFLNYYLPTTLKILRSYAQLDAQGVEGENITAAKQRIEGMMDKVVEGFETQLDKLFADSAMDISSDVAVLEQMLEKDGLSSQSNTFKGSGQGMTL